MSVEVDDVWLYEMILDYLKKAEEGYPTLIRESPHFSNGDRKVIVEWISKLAKIFKVDVEAHHLAIFLFDFFIADHQADSQGLYLIGAASFSVACKVNDVEVNVPQSSKILKLAPFENVMQSCLLKSTEILILQHFNWNVHKATEASFLEYYAASCLALELEGIDDAEYSNKIAKYFNKWITYFREKVLLNDEFRDYLPSKVACSIVISARISMSLFPEWPEIMIRLSGWKMSELGHIIHNLRNGLTYDLLMEKKHMPNLDESAAFDKNCFTLKSGSVGCSNHGDIEFNLPRDKPEEKYLEFSTSEEPLAHSLTISIEPTNYESTLNYFASGSHDNDCKDANFTNSKGFINQNYASMKIISEPSIYISNTFLATPGLMIPISNENNQLYFSTESNLDPSVDSLSTACDTSFNISSGPYSLNDSYSNRKTDKPRVKYYQKPEYGLGGKEDIEPDSYDPTSEDMSSSASSLYLIVSQSQSNHGKQSHSTHSHSIVVDSNNLPSRRSQNRDSIISNSMNNGYYALKKRAPGLVINVNGAGSSYTFNCVNNGKSTHR